MRLTINIATRNRPELLKTMVERTLPNISRPDTTLMISADQDDQPTIDVLKAMTPSRNLLISIKPREDSRGEKYDRALTEAPADIYLPGVDYAPFLTEGFDQRIIDAAGLWPDGIGVVYGPMCDELVPMFQAPTAKFVEKIGYIFNHDYPFWFIDHELADIAWMIGRISFTKVRMDVRNRPTSTMRLRDLDFWTAYFDLMALDRRAKARDIINSPEFEAPDWLKHQLSTWFPLVEKRSESRNARVRATAAQCEQARGDKGPPDEGYLRAKSKAEHKLSRLYAAFQAAA